jgi:hypothetical protein
MSVIRHKIGEALVLFATRRRRTGGGRCLVGELCVEARGWGGG